MFLHNYWGMVNFRIEYIQILINQLGNEIGFKISDAKSEKKYLLYYQYHIEYVLHIFQIWHRYCSMDVCNPNP